MPRPDRRLGRWLRGLLVCLVLIVSRDAAAIPAFAWRTGTSCETCHQGRFPRLNAYGRRYQEAGFQLPDGAEDAVRARRSFEPGDPATALALLREAPLSIRGQVFEVVRPTSAPPEQPRARTTSVAYLMGGGAIAPGVSYFFSWSPFPAPMLHHARIGVHDLFAARIGRGTLNLRAGQILLLDFARPSHRFSIPGADASGAAVAGNNTLSTDAALPGIQLYGRPGWGPWHYEIAAVAGDAPGGVERDDHVDGFARTSFTLFQNTDHEVTPAVFGYLGRATIVTALGDVVLSQQDDVVMVGGDLDAMAGPFALNALVWTRRHGDPANDGAPVRLTAVQAELLWTPSRRVNASVRYDQLVVDGKGPTPTRNVAAQVGYAIAPNVIASVSWRQDLIHPDASTAVGVLDAAF